MPASFKPGLSQQLALVVGSTSLLIAILLVLLGSFSSRYILEQQQDNRGRELAQQVARDVAPVLATSDLIRLEVTLRQLLQQHRVQHLTVSDIDGNTLARSGHNDTPGTLAYRADIAIDGDIAGEVTLVTTPGTAQAEQRRMLLGLLFLALLLCLFGAAVVARWGQGLASRVSAVTELLLLEPRAVEGTDEILALEEAAANLPLDLLKPPSGLEQGQADYQQAALLYIRLDSLSSYVEALDENSLLRYTEMQRRIVHGAGQLYGGTLTVARQFGLLLSFSGQHAAGSPVFRAASAAWLIQLLTQQLQEGKSLRYKVSQALGVSESGVGSSRDIYPDLYNQHVIDELDGLLSAGVQGVQLNGAACEDGDASHRCRLSIDSGGCLLAGFEEPYSDLLERQARLLLRELSGSD
jgi:uncharacterized membrane protein affecting hemolysin expression